MRFADRVVFVAGGTGGLGRAVSLAFAHEGAAVVTPFRQRSEFESLLQLAGKNAQSISGAELDLLDVAAVQSIVEQHAKIDFVVNCTGGYKAGMPLWETQPEVLEQMLSLNLRAGFNLFRAVLPRMLERGRGAIVNVVARAAIDHAANASAYAASKAAALALTDCLAAETKDRGVRVNSILPSIIDTEANRRAMPKADFSKWPKPEDLAKVILFLCSDDSASVHGTAIEV